VLVSLAQKTAGRLGGKVGLAPRLFLKKLVGDVLDRIEEHPEFDPAVHYELSVTTAELNEVERAAAGVVRGVDDIELDLASAGDKA
jgi:hypothetical protein